MAKGNGNKKQAAANGSERPMPAYFKSLTIENVKCFKGEHTIDLSDGNGKPAQWTVILGNNNTGKTTILKCLAGLQPVERRMISDPRDSSLVDYTTLGAEIDWPGNVFINGKNSFKISASIECRESLLGTSDEIFHELSYAAEYYESLGGIVHYRSNLSKIPLVESMNFHSYGAVRRMKAFEYISVEVDESHANLFSNNDLVNVEDWLLNLFLAEKLGQTTANSSLNLAKQLLISGILPDVKKVQLRSEEKGAGFENFVEFRTDFGWIRLRDLGYGYQTMIAWVLDLVKRMVERYPGSPDPLAEPAIVLVDEIDLHLHPDWQRRIIAHLTKYFPNTQFIVTAHSPLIVQSAEEINLVILKKEGESVHIEQPKIRTFRGWTVEEILTDLMDLGGEIMSKTYLDLMEQFNEALQDDDYEKAETAYQALDKILHPDSHQRTLLKLQMTSLSPAHAL